MGWISLNKDVFYEFHLLFELQSKRSYEGRNEGYESLSEGKWIERKIEKSKKLIEPHYLLAKKSDSQAPLQMLVAKASSLSKH